MLVVNRHGNKFTLPDDLIPEENKEWTYNETYLIPEDTELEECWVVQVCQKGFNEEHYNFVGEELFDHEPSKDEIIYVMCKNNALRCSYAEVFKCYRYHETWD